MCNAYLTKDGEIQFYSILYFKSLQLKTCPSRKVMKKKNCFPNVGGLIV